MRLAQQLQLNVIDQREVARGHWELVLPLEAAMRRVAPGQFVNFLCRDGSSDDPLLRRPFSVYTVSEDTFSVLYRVVGRGTTLLSQFRSGDVVDVIGPLGHGFVYDALSESGRPVAEFHVVLVGGGVGVPPMFFLSQRLGDAGIPHTVLVGFADADQVVAVDRWRDRGIEPHISTDDGSMGHRGFVTELLDRELARKEKDAVAVYACGPKPMLAAVSQRCIDQGIPCQVAMEEWMGCGLGVCLSCVCPVQTEGAKTEWARICREGPVLDGHKVVWS